MLRLVAAACQVLVCLLSLPTANAQAYGAICWQDEAGFLIGLPENWQHVTEAAEKYQLCLMGIPGGTNFDDAPVILYPRIFARSPDQAPALLQVAREVRSMRVQDTRNRTEQP
jgi:hypothetical protein